MKMVSTRNAAVSSRRPAGRGLLAARAGLVPRVSLKPVWEASWGEAGTEPGQFNIPHNICCDPEGCIYVADRENHRVQVFDRNGKWETQWNYLHRPNGMCLTRGHDPLCYIGESAPQSESNRDWPNIGPRVSIHTLRGAGAASQDTGRHPAGPVQHAARHRRR
jgi:hypothetical protein